MEGVAKGGEKRRAWLDVVSPKKGSSFNTSCIGPLLETPTSKVTWAPLLSTANIPFSNSPVQFPCPFCNAISKTPSPPPEPGFLVVLPFERKNRGAVFEFVHSATDIVSWLSFEGIENEGGLGSVCVLSEATALIDNCCAWTMAEMSRQISASGNIKVGEREIGRAHV